MFRFRNKSEPTRLSLNEDARLLSYQRESREAGSNIRYKRARVDPAFARTYGISCIDGTAF